MKVFAPRTETSVPACPAGVSGDSDGGSADTTVGPGISAVARSLAVVGSAIDMEAQELVVRGDMRRSASICHPARRYKLFSSWSTFSTQAPSPATRGALWYVSVRLRIAGRRLVLCSLLCVCLGGWLAGASEAFPGVVAGQEEPSGVPSLLLGSPFQAAPVLAPQQVAADEASRSAFEGLGPEAAVSLAKQDFNIQQPVWTTPGTEEGGHLESYLGENAAVEKLPGGQHVVVSSTVPLRTGGAPVSLALRTDGEEGYVPENPLVPVVISKDAHTGIAFPLGISTAPVSAASSGSPAVAGNGVMFANVAQDADLIEEPLPYGAGVSWQLRSQRSPEEESLRFTLPPGAALQTSKTISGGAEVSEEGKTVVLIPPASAQDAAGHALATSYSISGSVLTTHVDLRDRKSVV